MADSDGHRNRHRCEWTNPSRRERHADKRDLYMLTSQYNTGSTTAILDTNVLVSCLHLIQQLVHEQMQRNKHEVLFVVPGIVIQELDGLRAKEGVSAAARRANDWLLPRVNRLPCLRGQRTSESPRGNWMYNREGASPWPSNDSLITNRQAFIPSFKTTTWFWNAHSST